MDHPNLLWLYEIIDDPNKDDIYLVTEYYSRGSLANKVKEKNKKYLHTNYELKKQGK